MEESKLEINAEEIKLLESINKEKGKKIYKLIKTTYESLNETTKLILWYKDISDIGIKFISKKLKSTNSLLSLSLGYCKIQTEGMIELSNALENHPTLKELILGYKFRRALYSLLVKEDNNYKFPMQEQARLMANTIKDEGAKAIAKLISTCKKLHIISVSYCNTNNITDQNCIINAINLNDSIKEIYIWGYSKDIIQVRGDIICYGP